MCIIAGGMVGATLKRCVVYLLQHPGNYLYNI